MIDSYSRYELFLFVLVYYSSFKGIIGNSPWFCYIFGYIVDNLNKMVLHWAYM